MTQIQLKRAATSGAAPPSLAPGELAINTTDNKLFWSDTSGTIRATANLARLVATDASGNVTLTGSLAATVVSATGGSAGFYAFDRSASGAATFYRAGGVAAIYDSTFGDVITFSSAGVTTVKGQLNGVAPASGDSSTLVPTTAYLTSYVLRADVAQTFSASSAAQARFNLGISAPLKISATTTLGTNLGIGREYEFTAAATATAPTTASVFDGWRTGVFHNRGNGSITTANFVGTIGVQSGDYLDGLLNGTKTLAYGQRGYLYYDAQATPNATWRWSWVDRSPILLAASYSAIASFDFAIPAGYQVLDWTLCKFVPSVSGSGLIARLSADGGATIKQASTDYTTVNVYPASSSAAGVSQASLSYLKISEAQNNAESTSRAGFSNFRMETKYGTIVGYNGYVVSGATDGVQILKAAQAGTLITPNLVRVLSSGGGTFSANVSIRGMPTS